MKWAKVTLVGLVLLFIIVGIAAGNQRTGAKRAVHTTTYRHVVATSSAKAPISARPRSKPKPQSVANAKAKPRPKPARPRSKPVSHPAMSAGLALSYASNDIVQAQPAPGSCRARGYGPLSEPDPHCTPGALNPAVTQASIGRTICVGGWTATVRPPEYVTEEEKVASMAAYGDTDPSHGYEYDHFVPLELGGATNDARNLWPEPAASPNPKDSVEDALHHDVCDGEMSLAQAQHIIVTDWVGWAHAHVASATETSSPAPVPTAPQAQASVPTPAPQSPPASSSVPVVHPGAFCAPEGAHGVTSAGTPMTCKTSTSDFRDRWRHS